MQRQEIPNHTPAQVHDHVAQAIGILDAFELTPDERANLLPHVFVMLGGKQIVMAQFTPPSLALPHGAGH